MAEHADVRGREDVPSPDVDRTPAADPPLGELLGQGVVERVYGTPADPAGIATRDQGVPAPIDLRESPARPPLPREVRARWRAFRSYWFGHLASNFGDHLTLVALPLAAEQLTGSGFVVGLVVSAETLATVLFGTAAGTLTDRRDPRPTMIWSDLARAAILALVAVLHWQGLEPAVLLVVAAFALGLLRLIHDGAESAMVARLIPDELDVRSNARLTLSENLGMTLGPLAAGAATTVGLWLAFGADALTFLVAALAVAAVGRVSRRRHFDLSPPPPEGPPVPFREEFRVAFAAIRAQRTFAAALVVMAVVNIAALPLGPQLVTLARQELGMSGFGIGAMFALGGLAGVVAGPILERTTVIRPAMILAGGAVLSAGVLLVGLQPSVGTVALAFLLAGVGLAAAMTHFAALRQRVFDPAVQGRITLTARMLLWAAIPPGALLGGWLSDAVDPAAMWWACGLAGIAACVWGLTAGLGRIRLD